MIDVDVQLDRGGFSLDVAFRSDVRVLGVFGPSGAGKSTLINVLAGLERPRSGSITVDGRTLFDATRGIDVPAHRRRVGVVFQEHRLFPHYSVRGNLLYGASRGSGGLDTVVDLLELEPLLARRVGQLSGGERQRVGLGRALLSEPRMLLLDEPLVSLDKRLRKQIIPYLRRVQDAVAIPLLYVSHELSEILQLTDRVLVLERGRVAGHGRYADIVHEDAVLSVVHDRGMVNMFRARVMTRDAADGISTLAIGAPGAPRGKAAASLVAPLAPETGGDEVTVSVQPWDIALAESIVAGTSIRNQLRGEVTRCTTHERRVLVEVDVGTRIVAEISRGSAASMRIAPGRPVVCLIKSHAIRYVG